MKLLRDNGLSLVLVVLFVALLFGQTVAGHREHNSDQVQHGEQPISYTSYLASPHFLEAMFENWESEFLQMGFYVILTAFLFQRGSSESKDPDKQEKVDEDPRIHRQPDSPSPVRRGGWRLRFYEYSLSIALLLLFLVSFAGHAIWGRAEYNDELASHGEPPLSLVEYAGSSRFWFESLQNWQSEFLAVAALAVLGIFLRQRGSPESKPVAAPHSRTGSS